MDFKDFKKLVEKNKAENPEAWRVHEELVLGDAPATEDDIARVEAELKAKLPQDYVAFLKEYGGGLFGTDVYSAKADSNFYIVDRQLPSDYVQNFVAVSPNGCGDEYGFRVVDGQCQPELLFCDHEEGFELFSTEYASILDYLSTCL